MLLIDKLTVVTMDEQRNVLTGAAIAIEDERIAMVGASEELRKRYQCVDTLDGTGMVAMPGLIDTHAHADQALLRGLGDCMHWVPFLDDVVEPYLAKRDPADGVLGNTLAMMEMLRGGTTCFVSPNVDPRDDYEAMTAAIGKLGIRAVLGRFIVPHDGADNEKNANHAVANASTVMNEWHGAEDGLVTMWFGLMVPRVAGDTDHPAFYKAVAEQARKMGVGVVYHFCSEFEDAVYIQNTYGVRPAEWSRDNHALGPNVLLINGCQVTPLEIEILANTGTHLAHSPVANMKMATGILPVPDVLAAGVNVSLGTDGALNNNSYDMFAEMKTACLLQNSVRRNAQALTAETALEMATIHGARAIGREQDMGSIEAGKLADVVLVEMRRLNTCPVHDVISNLVFATNSSNVHTVFVGGRKVVDRGVVLGIDEAGILERAQQRAGEISSDLGLKTASSWPNT